MVDAQQRASQAISGVATALTDITQELRNVQEQLQYWRIEADAWKARYEQEKARSDRLRRVLRCTPSNPAGSGLTAQPSLTSTPRALRHSGSFTLASGAAAACSVLTSGAAALQQAPCSSRLGLQQHNNGSTILGRSSFPPPGRQQQQQLAGWASSGDHQGSNGSSSNPLSPTQQQQQQQQQQASLVQQRLKPLRCVPEGSSDRGSNSSSSTELAQQYSGRQPGSAGTPTAHISSSTALVCDTTPTAAGAAAAPVGPDSPCAGPFAHYLGAVSDPGGPFRPQQQQQQQDTDSHGLPPQLEQQQQQDQERSLTPPCDRLAAAGGQPGADSAAAAAAGLSGPTFRRARTMPPNSSFSAVQSPTFAAGMAPGALLHQAASWLPPMYGGSSGDRVGSRHTVDQLLRVMMAFTLMQGAAEADEQQPGEGQDEDVLPSVSLDDDDGSSGVGLAAAAAVSAAMARAWASAASREQRAVAAAAGSGSGGSKVGAREPGGSSSGRAGFRLVATVTNKMGKRQTSTSALSSIASQDSLDSSSSDLPALLRDKSGAMMPSSKHNSSSSLAPSPPSEPTTTPAAAAADTSSSISVRGGGGSQVPPAAPAAGGGSASPSRSVASGRTAPQAAASAASSGGASTSQATTISLQWLSRPRTVLVMRKLAPSTEAAFLRALDWLRRHQVTIFVEPKVFQELVDAGRVVPITPSTPKPTLNASSSSSSKPVDGNSSSKQVDGSSSSSAVPQASSSGNLTGMLISTAQAAQQQGLFPANSWAGPTRPGSSGGSTTGVLTAGQAAAAGAVVGAGGAAAGVIKTWQQEQQQGGDQQGQQLDSSKVAASDLIPEAVAQQLDLVVVLGGDGTVLWTCHIFGNRSVPPLVPFNLGSLGFLTPFDPARLEQVLLKTFRGGFPITLRHRLHCTIVRCSSTCGDTSSSTKADEGLPCVSNRCVGHCVYGEEHVSLNEVVIERGISPFLTNLECFCDGTFVTHVQGDGLIVGTPTGSTAYSLAAGGSMVHPQVPCILFTPICPHSLSFRPLMFPDYVQLCVQVPADARGHVWASFDGKDRTELGPGDAVVIRLSKWPVPSVAAEADPSSDWFSAVRECLHWNMRKVQGGAGM